MDSDDFLPEMPEVDVLLAALGPAARVAYAPPNIYPMSAPRFRPEPAAPRCRPAGNTLGIYVHVPFCNYRCTFCFYATRLTPSADEMRRYVRAIERELEWVEPGTRLAQFYCGGGTPTALPAELLDRLLTSVFARVVNRGDDVHTVECSPESLTAAHVEVLRKHAIGRVSMGVQSLQGRVQTTVQRVHSAQRVFESCDALISAGLMVNVDLIYGLPGQTESSFCDDFTALAERGVHSFTAYNLRVNERTPVGRALAEHERLDLQRLVRWRSTIRAHAARHGFVPTRWHTFKRCDSLTAADVAGRYRDNTGQGDQFGVGCSARSRLSNVVYRNQSRYDKYLDRIERCESPVEEAFELGPADRRVRYVALTLGDGEPLCRDAYARELGSELDDDYAALLDALADAGLIHDDGLQITLSPPGQLVYDLVTRAFYPEHVRHWLQRRQQLAGTAANLRTSPGSFHQQQFTSRSVSD